VEEYTSTKIDKKNVCVFEFRIDASKNDTGNFFFLTGCLTNFSNNTLVCELPNIKIYSDDHSFIPISYKEEKRYNLLFPDFENLNAVTNVEISSRDSIQLIILFKEMQRTKEYETLLDENNADILVKDIILLNNKNQRTIFPDVYFEKYY
jgi:hypothetical protein